MIFVDETGNPDLVLNAHRFLCDVIFRKIPIQPEIYLHHPIVVDDMNTRLGDVIRSLKIGPEHPDIIDQDVVLL